MINSYSVTKSSMWIHSSSLVEFVVAFQYINGFADVFGWLDHVFRLTMRKIS